MLETLTRDALQLFEALYGKYRANINAGLSLERAGSLGRVQTIRDAFLPDYCAN